MTTFIPTNSTDSEIFYPSSDGEPLAESYDHVQVILVTFDVLTRYIKGIQATVLANQFLYYREGFPNYRVTPDVMVIYDVEPGGRNNYKIWQEKQVPKVIFEMTSQSTKTQDLQEKKNIYEQLGVVEYWLFDPRGEWIKEQLKGYRLQGKTYQLITDNLSEPLKLRLEIVGKLIGFYRLDTGEKLLTPEELRAALAQSQIARQQAETKAQQAISITQEAEMKQQAETKAQQAEMAKQQAETKIDEMEALLAHYRQQFGEIE